MRPDISHPRTTISTRLVAVLACITLALVRSILAGALKRIEFQPLIGISFLLASALQFGYGLWWIWRVGRLSPRGRRFTVFALVAGFAGLIACLPLDHYAANLRLEKHYRDRCEAAIGRMAAAIGRFKIAKGGRHPGDLKELFVEHYIGVAELRRSGWGATPSDDDLIAALDTPSDLRNSYVYLNPDSPHRRTDGIILYRRPTSADIRTCVLHADGRIGWVDGAGVRDAELQ